MKHTLALLTGLLLLAGGIRASQGAVAMTAVEIGGDVVFSASGTLDLAAWDLVLTDLGSAHVWADCCVGVGGGLYTLPVESYGFPLNFDGPLSYGPSVGLRFPDNGTGDDFGLVFRDPTSIALTLGITRIAVPEGYVSESPLSGTATYTGETFASLGVSPGIYTWTWGSGGNADSLTLTAIPEPSRALLSLLGLGGVCMRRRR